MLPFKIVVIPAQQPHPEQAPVFYLADGLSEAGGRSHAKASGTRPRGGGRRRRHHADRAAT